MSGTSSLRRVPVADLTANPANVRESLDGIEELAASIRANGLLQPLIVNERGSRLTVTDGHRRLAAARLAGVPALLCIVTEGDDDQRVTATMLAAAMHRELRPIEQARAFDRLKSSGMTTADISRSTGYSTALIRQRLLLIELPVEAQEMVEDSRLTIGDAATLAKQVKAKGSGSVQVTRSAWLTTAHPLALSVECSHSDSRTIVGGVACGQCWEAAIRADERGDLDVTPVHDEALVVRVLGGERLPMTRADRLEGVRRLVAQRLNDLEIATRLNCSKRQVLRDRQALGLAAPVESGSGLPKSVAS